MKLLIVLLLLVVVNIVTGVPEKENLITITAAIVLSNKQCHDAAFAPPPIWFTRRKPCKRRRKTVPEAFAELGPYYQRRAYRMDEPAFWNLYKILKPYMRGVAQLMPRPGSKKHGGMVQQMD